MVMHVHLRENGTLLQTEGNIDDCPSQYCQEKHDRDSMYVDCMQRRMIEFLDNERIVAERIAVRAETQRDELAVKLEKMEAKFAKLKAKHVR